VYLDLVVTYWYYLFIYLLRYIDHKALKGPVLVFESSYHLFLPLKVEAIMLSALPKDTTSEFAISSSHYLFNAEHQVEKL